jgi:hypothetical protein
MRGYITERDFWLCDEAFPGIVSYYEELEIKPATFLELLWGFQHRDEESSDPSGVAMCPAAFSAAR